MAARHSPELPPLDLGIQRRNPAQIAANNRRRQESIVKFNFMNRLLPLFDEHGDPFFRQSERHYNYFKELSGDYDFDTKLRAVDVYVNLVRDAGESYLKIFDENNNNENRIDRRQFENRMVPIVGKKKRKSKKAPKRKRSNRKRKGHSKKRKNK